MAWDSSRPVPWRRLIKDWLVYVAIMTVVLGVIYRDRLSAGLFAGVFASGPIFVLMGALLAKLGYQRKTLRQLRVETDAKVAENTARSLGTTSGAGATGRRPRPAPTKRTAGGGGRPAQHKKR